MSTFLADRALILKPIYWALLLSIFYIGLAHPSYGCGLVWFENVGNASLGLPLRAKHSRCSTEETLKQLADSDRLGEVYSRFPVLREMVEHAQEVGVFAGSTTIRFGRSSNPAESIVLALLESSGKIQYHFYFPAEPEESWRLAFLEAVNSEAGAQLDELTRYPLFYMGRKLPSTPKQHRGGALVEGQQEAANVLRIIQALLKNS